MSWIMCWKGSETPNDISGTATYTIDGDEFVFPLPSFAYAHRLGVLLNIVGKYDERRVLNLARRRLLDMVSKLEDDLGALRGSKYE